MMTGRDQYKMLTHVSRNKVFTSKKSRVSAECQKSMGCVQARHSVNSPPRRLESLKLETGYVKGENGRQAVDQKQVLVDPIKIFKHGMDRNGSAKRMLAAVGGGGDKSALSRDVGKVKNNGSMSQRIVLKKIAADEYIDGWPKWLVENVPREALEGLAKKTADSYDMLAKVGHGTYSNVYKARDRDTDKIVALKKVSFDTSEPESVKFMAREIMMLRKLDHPNIIKLKGIVTSRMQYSLYLVFEFMQSDLTKLIFRPSVKLTLPQVKFYMNQLLSGLRHCHERGILHRDIKASNLLIDSNGELKIADFGLANYFHPKPKKPLTSRVVTLWYRAPELLLGSTDYGIGIDLWSAGCVLAEMLQGRAIMPGRTECSVISLIAETDPNAWNLRPDIELGAILYSAVGGTAAFGITVWCIGKKGPVFAAMFGPLGVVIAALLSAIFLGDTLHIGSVVGAIIIVLGFYAVIWAKSKDEENYEKCTDHLPSSSSQNIRLLQDH